MERRKCSRIIRGQAAIDGAGVHLQRVLGLKTSRDFDPFLMLDGFDSTDPRDYIRGFPLHPHRGIETVTYLLHGEIEHRDSLGNQGVIRDLQCQWMTAGSGILHEEMPKASERMLGCQLWVNLPAVHKMVPPAYRDVRAEDVAVVEEEHARVRVISGAYKGKQGAVHGEYIPVLYLDVTLEAMAEWRFAGVPNDHTLFLYLIDGEMAADENMTLFEAKACAMLMEASLKTADVTDEVAVKAGPKGARFFLLAAQPLGEPIAWGGPIVMNTQQELQHAFDELDQGTFIKHDR